MKADYSYLVVNEDSMQEISATHSFRLDIFPHWDTLDDLKFPIKIKTETIGEIVSI
jgi:hypothetical protein